jgi:hypothetical protein
MNTLEKEREELMQALDWILADYEGICRNQFPPSANWEKRILKAHSALRISSQDAAVALAPQPEQCVICGEGFAALETMRHPETGKEVNVRSCPSCELSYVHENEQPVASVQDVEEPLSSTEVLAQRIRDILGPYNDDHESLQVLVSNLVLKLDDMQEAQKAAPKGVEHFIATHSDGNGFVGVGDLLEWMAGHARVDTSALGDWLWCALMDYCKTRGTSPANNQGLFKIVSDFRAMLTASKESE